MVAELLWLELVWVVDWWAGVKVLINSFSCYYMIFVFFKVDILHADHVRSLGSSQAIDD